MSAMERFLVFKKIAISLIKIFSYFESKLNFHMDYNFINVLAYAF